MADNTNTNTNVGLLGWLFLILLILKLNPGGHLTTPVADASWWWVTAPLWGGVLLVVAIFAVGFAVLFAVNLHERRVAAKARAKRWREIEK